MFLHYAKIALRNLSRQPILAFINVFGLSVGIACFSLFLLYALNELSYDQFHKNGNEIYRVIDWSSGDKNNEPGGDASSYTPVGPAIKQDFPEIENFVRISGARKDFVKAENKVSRCGVSFADRQLLRVFSFKLLAGNATDALSDPHSVILTRDKAMQLFGSTDVLGKRIDIKTNDQEGQFEAFKISGVAENIPSRSTIQFDILGSFDYVLGTEEGRESINNWHMTLGINTYVQVRKGSQLMNNPVALQEFRHKYYADEESIMKKEGRWDGKSPYPFSFRLQPLRQMHTSVQVDSGAPGSTTNPKNLWILISIAAGILLIACINFTTLAIGRSAGRAREVGVRKVIGSGRKQLIYQFLTESMLLSILSGILGWILANGLLPFFNRLSERQLEFSFQEFPQVIWILIGMVLLVGLLAGSYPAFVLSGFRPVEVLKSKIKLGGSNLFTKSLVTFQFVLSSALIISTVIIFMQLHFMRSKNLGLSKDNVIVINTDGVDTKKVYPLFRHSVQSQRQVIAVSASEIGLGEGQGQMGGQYLFGDKKFSSIEYPVDEDYLTLMGMKLMAGRNFDLSIPTDTVNSVIVNETLAETVLGMHATEAIGQQIKGRGDKIKTIIGVIKDFNFEPLTRMVRPELLVMPASFLPNKIFVKLQPGDLSMALSKLQLAWKSVVPDFPFEYSFLDEDLDRFYKSEQKWGDIVGWAGGISIFLACLGLFGLAALAAANRTKEIGIRKVMGASISSIVRLLSGGFLKLVLIALLIASPFAWYFMKKWLEDYAYRIDIGWGVFAITGVISLLIALVTISFQTIKVAIANPVKSLRTE